MKNVYDIDYYNRHKSEFFLELIKLEKVEFLDDLRKLIFQKYPKEMEKAKLRWEKLTTPVAPEHYNLIRKYYDISISLLGLGLSLNEALDRLFNIHSVKNICIIGTSNIGNIILNAISKKYNIILFNEKNIENCDCAIILYTRTKQINESWQKLSKNNIKTIYSITTLHKAIMKSISTI